MDGISWASVRRANGDLSVDAFRKGEPGKRGGGSWWWKLPGLEGHVLDAQPSASQKSTLIPDPVSAGQGASMNGHKVKPLNPHVVKGGARGRSQVTRILAAYAIRTAAALTLTGVVGIRPAHSRRRSREHSWGVCRPDENVAQTEVGGFPKTGAWLRRYLSGICEKTLVVTKKGVPHTPSDIALKAPERVCRGCESTIEAQPSSPGRPHRFVRGSMPSATKGEQVRSEHCLFDDQISLCEAG